jgi:hypothetical protein
MTTRDTIDEKFKAVGARVRVNLLDQRPQRRWNGRRTMSYSGEPVVVDVKRDARGEFFDVWRARDVHVRVLDIRPRDRHLLLGASFTRFGLTADSRFLCGRDERSWFVAAIPEQADATTVQAAKDALKPREVWDAIREFGVRPEDRDKRWTKAFVRHGEWFFIPRPAMDVSEASVVRNEPIRRGAGKPHWCQFLYREDGEAVYVHSHYPNGVTAEEFAALPDSQRRMHGWRQMFRDATVYVKGSIRHADHDTIWLPFWHKVVMNTETQAEAMSQVAFLD